MLAGMTYMSKHSEAGALLRAFPNSISHVPVQSPVATDAREMKHRDQTRNHLIYCLFSKKRKKSKLMFVGILNNTAATFHSNPLCNKIARSECIFISCNARYTHVRIP